MGWDSWIDADVRFYWGVGGFMIIVFVSALATVAALDLVTIDRRAIPLAIGFSLFMIVYFVSVAVLRLEPDGH